MAKCRSWWGRAPLAWAALLCFSVSLQACKRKNPTPARPTASAQTPREDPAGFQARAAGLAERWKGADALLPDCAPLLEQEADRATCTAARAAVATLTAALTRGAQPGELLPLVATAALSAQRAAQRLRSSGVARLFEERPARPIPSASSASVAPKRPAANLSSGAASALVRSQGSRDLHAIGAYARIATLGLRDLATYLEFGPLALRRQSFAELERLTREEPHWAALRALVNEALLVESDPSLKRELVRLREQLG
jgi:hypothetical protein